MRYTLIDNPSLKGYEFHIEDKVARIEYIKAQDKIYLTHTEVPQALEGRGIASQLVQQVLEDIKAKDLTLVPMCPFVAMYVKRHPEWKSLVLKGINIS
ncbi:Acetyltransferase [Croceitalea dokdonensis DOKDO 023]|uniref:Acetyltransferase n=1 Tax=Croceitalea dokdonensis DOKDO 023 TaxID=1300341 RepID=A0A0P7AFV2_9FLAO|nr:GNAT family N-acetyltransferase [Croceitalea dokdonensis]KPM32242.1 Acetyltransferase [Croceitalea dokdonensis DOKDO 023]